MADKDWLENNPQAAVEHLQFEEFDRCPIIIHHPIIPESLIDLGDRCISQEEDLELMRVPSAEEVKEAVWSLHPLKSPGPDGFSSIFFRSYSRTNFNQFRSISLYNFVYKIVAKILAGRLSKVLDKLISPNQGAFIKGRWIAENFVVAQEIVHKVRTHKGKKDLMIIKMDLKKVYDSLEWSFIDKALEAWVFSGCQMDATKLLLLKEEVQEKLHGIKITRNAPAVSHLMYANDLLIMCRADPQEATVVNECFNNYCSWSGQAANSEKSNILFSKSTSRRDRKAIRDIRGFKEMGSKAVYLGNSFIFGRNKSKEFFKLKERIQNRLEG
ncbi:uncharacterized protein LOC132800728 [Ziziphus jujuba]|uniref:Uncharacterized protein LOC132800728 n=1 Tax=Ziziphus jujuba TaxID=326968 RepID=A0ABM4A2K5_ZIZJJ|nr:uncharacterized protein LOC132800728 [Ziziphus jujuba]